MKFAILAAGEGSRLAQEGIEMPKPLVRINGEAMIDRLIRIFMENGAEEIFVITNNLTTLVQEHLSVMVRNGIPLRLVVKTTPSSMHSFYELKNHIGEGKFCLTTVDTIFDEREFSSYISEFRASACDGMMAVTDYIDDEKPLYISTDSHDMITGFHDSLELYGQSEAGKSGLSVCKYISGGIYCLDSKAFVTLDKCIDEGMSRMRNFQRQLVFDGLCLKACRFSKILDVDHAGDIRKAEEFLNAGR
ncbi:MAG: NTP transferase domain-containing protein [Bacteroides sp.]|nr:NTP transferase domain-containing protein [Roseburia sp.]MCM1347167.1 NTP transferase domain-containing protein [Bacteroides sp.]MCM1421159.1 NTP transferase domain-containing protein [Bacteroides sp.]